MKTLLLSVCLIAAASAASLHHANNLRRNRDVSEVIAEPANNYLPPEPESTDANAAALSDSEEPEQDSEQVEAATAASAFAPEESAVLGRNGYEYRTVRKLRLRQRRDVSHLNLGYLPPVEKPRPAKVYLPPQVEELPPAPKPSNEYLPPELHEAIKSEPISVESEEDTEAPATEEPATTEAVTEEQQDTAVFADDGYHYKKPAVVPDLGPANESEEEPEAEKQEAAEPEPEPEPSPEAPVEQPVREYLPPFEDESEVDMEAPEEENNALNDDGYHYRVLKRYRFF